MIEQMTSQTAGWSLKTIKQYDNKTSGEEKQMKQGALGC